MNYFLITEEKESIYFQINFFFDEIQNIENWEKFIRRIDDTLNCGVFLTGSSSKFLSKEIATSLRGRTISFEVFPLNFSEYLTFNNIDKNYYSSKNRAQIINTFDKYLRNSAFPELLYVSEIEKPKILKEYLDLIIYNDVIERYNISNLFLIKYLIKFFIVNTGNLISIIKTYNDLKSQEIKASKDSLYKYIEYLEEAYVLFSVKIFSDNLRETQRNAQKIYSIDSGLMDVLSTNENLGRRFENIVF